MIKLRIPSDHPNASVIQPWALDKENILDTHTKQLKQLQGFLQTLVSNNPDLVKAPK